MIFMSPNLNYDVVVIGGGNAGFSAAVSAAQSQAGRVLLIDKCPEEWAGGNSYFTAGAFRTVHGGLDDLLPIVTNVDDETAKIIDLSSYTREDFLNDMDRITDGKFDRELGRVLVDESNEAVKWLAGNGLKFELSFNRQVSLTTFNLRKLFVLGTVVFERIVVFESGVENWDVVDFHGCCRV
jgi:succinate dehydrogenase/fumarate reductase flavoprotein subunit